MRVERLLSILLMLSRKGTVTGKELAEHFEVSLRTIYRDIEKISEGGIPIAAIGGKGGGFYIMENYSLDKLFLNDNELETVTAVMSNLGFLFDKNRQYNDLILKFENQYRREKGEKDKLSIDMSHFSMENELKEYLYLINKAIEDSRLLEFDYINRNMAYMERIVEPNHISFSHGQWYLIGFCRYRKDYRKFKLVRIRSMKLGEGFIKRDITNEALQALFDAGYKKKSIKITLEFTNKIGLQLEEYFTKDCIKPLENGSYLVEDFFPHEEGLVKFILGFGKECQVIEPLYLKEEIRAYIIALLEKYNE